MIPWELESTPLQIKTDSALGSGHSISFAMYPTEAQGVYYIGFILVKFSNPSRYYKHKCKVWTDLPVQPPSELEKVWTFTKTEDSFIIHCNNVKVLNLKFSDSSLGQCVTTWEGTQVGKILFYKNAMFNTHDSDTASDSYRGKTILSQF